MVEISTKQQQSLPMVAIPTDSLRQQVNVLPKAVTGTNDPLFIDLTDEQYPPILSMVVAEHDPLNIKGNNEQLALNLKQEFAHKHGNSINYVARYIEHIHQNPELLKLTVLEDIRTAVVEHPLAEVGKTFEYQLNWQDKKLKFGAQFMDEIYTEGEANKAGQIPLFEIKRNVINKQNYEKMKTLYVSGYRGQMVEFSPSPDMNTQHKASEALRRGYKGYDSIFVYDFSDPNNLKVEQTWLNKSDISEWRNLLWQVSLDGANDEAIKKLAQSAITPEDIMRASKDFNESQMYRIRQFIESKKINKLGKTNEIGKAESEISQSIDNEIYPMVANLGNRIIEGSVDSNQIELELQTIFEKMTIAQYKLYAIIKGVDLNQIAQLDHGGLINKIHQEGFSFVGCGIGDLTGRSSAAVSAVVELNKQIKGYDETKDFYCSNCGHHHDIDTFKGKLEPRCKNCGLDATC